MTQTLSIILPAHNEANFIADCAKSLFDSDPLPAGWEIDVVVVANGCSDDTAEIARSMEEQAHSLGWTWTVIELDQGSKIGALNEGDATAVGTIFVYLDVDVRVSPQLLTQITEHLSDAHPGYCSGTPEVDGGSNWVTRSYARFWSSLPFVQDGCPGFGIFAMNQAGRERLGRWPDIISDDTYARLHFAPSERVRLQARYEWPMVQGFRNLVRVRRRQNQGVRQVQRLFPELLQNDNVRSLGFTELLMRLIRDPLGFAVYATVALTVKTPLFKDHSTWARGR